MGWGWGAIEGNYKELSLTEELPPRLMTILPIHTGGLPPRRLIIKLNETAYFNKNAEENSSVIPILDCESEFFDEIVTQQAAAASGEFTCAVVLHCLHCCC